MHQDCTNECWKEEYVKIHFLVANCQFGNFVLPDCHGVVQVAFWAERASMQVCAVCINRMDVHQYLCASSVFVD
jgi:hypothetical protein